MVLVITSPPTRQLDWLYSLVAMVDGNNMSVVAIAEVLYMALVSL
jgi:hypothetical protein